MNTEPVDVVQQWYWRLDERRYEAMLDLMADDGVWLRQGKCLQGRQAVLDALSQRSATLRVRHVLTNGCTAIDAPGGATVTAYQTVYRDPSAQDDVVSVIAGPSQLSVVTAHLRRDDAGAWRIAHLSSRRAFSFANEVGHAQVQL